MKARTFFSAIVTMVLYVFLTSPISAAVLLEYEGDAFGTRPVGEARDYPFSLYATTSGGITFPADPISITGDAAADFEVVDLDLSPLAEDTYRYFSIRFNPTAVGLREAALEITTSDPGTPVTYLELSGTGALTAPDLEADPYNFSLAYQAYESGSTLFELTLTNSGNVPLNFINSQIQISPSYSIVLPGGFSFVSAPDTSPLDPNTSRTVTVEFDPDTFGRFGASIEIESDDPDFGFLVQPMNAYGVATQFTEAGPIAAASPDPFDFGTVHQLNITYARNNYLTNLGLNDLVLDSTNSVTISPAGTPFTVSYAPNGAVVSSGEIVQPAIYYRPTEYGEHTATLSINSNDSTSPLQIPLIGRAEIQPGEISVSHTQRDFFEVEVGSTSSQKVVTVYNGPGTLNLLEILLTGPDASEFNLATLPLSNTIDPYQFEEIGITFSPTSEGEKEAYLEIVSNDTDETTTVVTLNGTGHIPGPDLYVQIDPIVMVPFYQNETGENTEFINLYNEGDQNLIIDSITLDPAGDNGFGIDNQGLTFPLTLAPFATAYPQVTFSSNESINFGERTTNIIIESNDPASPYILPVSIEYRQSQSLPFVPQSSIDFGGIYVGGSRVGVSSVNFSNQGSESLILESFSITGPDAALFSMSASTPSSPISPGTGYVYKLTFSPDTVGEKSALLTLNTNSLSVPVIDIPLSGTGLAGDSELAYFPNTYIDFGKTLVNEPSTPRFVYLKNNGSLPLNFTGDGIALTGDSVFSLDTTLDLSTIQPGEIRSFEIAYTPVDLSSDSGLLTITTDNTNSSLVTIPVYGEGLGSIPVKAFDSNGPGISTVGPGGIYSSLSEVRSATQFTNLYGGDWTFIITGDLTESESFGLSAPGNHSYIFKPEQGISPIISFVGDSTSSSMAIYNGTGNDEPAGNVYIYGSNDPDSTERNMTITNNAFSNNLLIIQDEVLNVRIQNLNLISKNQTYGSSYPRYAVSVTGSESYSMNPTLTDYPTDVLVKNCLIQALEGDNCAAVQIRSYKSEPFVDSGSGAQNIVFEGNEVQTAGLGFIIDSVRSLTLSENQVRVVRPGSGFSTYGLGVLNSIPIDSTEIRIVGNEFDNISLPQTSGSNNLYGLFFAGNGLNHHYSLINNMVNGIRLTSSGSVGSLRGIGIFGPDEATFDIYHNTVNIIPSEGSYSGLSSSNCYAIGSAGILDATINLKNNILRNGQENGTALLYEGGGVTLNAENNMLWADNGPIARVTGTDYNDLSSFAAAYPQYTSGTSSYDPILPMDGTKSRFAAGNVLPADTHLTREGPASLMASPLSGIATDFDGETRPESPDLVTMGADEPVKGNNGQPPAFVEDLAPNKGDGNDDGIPDSQQDNVVSLPSPKTGGYITIEADQGIIEEFEILTEDELDALPANVDAPYGILSYRISGIPNGSTVTLEFFFQGSASLTTFYKYGPEPSDTTNHWYEFLSSSAPGASLNSGSLTVQLVDGGRGDDDLSANGVIVDPSAPAFSTTSLMDWPLY